MIKVIALGNTLMEDDGIGIVVVNKLKETLEKNNIDVIIGETDFDFCISQIQDGDFIFFVDAAFYGKCPGEITVTPLNKYKNKCYFQHNISAIDMVKSHFKNIIHVISENVLKEILGGKTIEV
ncbi:hydrogenase maturation protease [Clostridium acetobutylicum]|uniref:hydrogenase maturation protease n=1 Tax=Clostridium acetobutylicum TaxID=1488 RepID=UPI000B5B4101|nr:hydrogenase maturation protease [Clostridium acetobutylicum]